MGASRCSVAVILSVDGSALDSRAVASMPVGQPLRVEFAHGERAACAAVTLEHDCDTEQLGHTLRSWAATRGWSVTVAPLTGGD